MDPESLEWNPNDAKSVRKANKKFNELVKPRVGGGTHEAFRVDRNTGGVGAKLEKFNKHCGKLFMKVKNDQ